MEIVTTVRDLPTEIQKHHLEPDVQVRVIVEEIPKLLSKKSKNTSRKFPFLDAPIWEGNEDSPTDISTNVDHYLYDDVDPHGS